MNYQSLAFANAQFKMEGDATTSTFSGYGAAFGNVDSGGDMIQKGAFKKTLKEFGLPKMFFNHDSWQVPIGKWLEAKEDDYGLLLTGEFTLGNPLAEQVRAALKHGTVDSMSIGYALRPGDYVDTEAGRTIKSIVRLFEVSPVTFPMNDKAKIDLASVKSFASDLEAVQTIRDFEYFLRDVGNFSKGAAQALTARAKQLFSSRDADEPDMEAKQLEVVLERLQRLTK